jgi:hypothetical protein
MNTPAYEYVVQVLRELLDAAETFASSAPEMVSHADDVEAFDVACDRARQVLATVGGRP